MKILHFLKCLINGHDWKYSVKQDGETVVARRDCKKCLYFELKVDSGE